MSGESAKEISGPVFGWRIWRIIREEFSDSYVFAPLNLPYPIYPDVLWKEPFHAVCHADEFVRSGDYIKQGIAHVIPHLKCQCGFYVKKSLGGLIEWFDDSWLPENLPVLAVGRAQMWGHVIEYETGYRAEFAKPVSAWLFYPLGKKKWVEQRIIPSLISQYVIPIPSHPYALEARNGPEDNIINCYPTLRELTERAECGDFD